MSSIHPLSPTHSLLSTFLLSLVAHWPNVTSFISSSLVTYSKQLSNPRRFAFPNPRSLIISSSHCFSPTCCRTLLTQRRSPTHSLPPAIIGRRPLARCRPSSHHYMSPTHCRHPAVIIPSSHSRSPTIVAQSSIVAHPAIVRSSLTNSSWNQPIVPCKTRPVVASFIMPDWLESTRAVNVPVYIFVSVLKDEMLLMAWTYFGIQRFHSKIY